MSRKRALLLGLLWVVVLAGADATILIRGDLLRRELDDLLARVFVSRVRVDDVQVRLGWNAEVRGVRVMRPDASDRPYGVVERLEVRPDWRSLFTFEPRVAEVTVVRPTVHVSWTPEGVLDMPSPFAAETAPRPRPRPEDLPAVRLEGLRLELERCPWLKEERAVVELDGFSVTLAPETSTSWLYRFEVALKSAALGDLEAEGRFDQERFLMTLRRRGFTPGRELIDALKPELADILRDVRLAGPMEFSAEVRPGDAPDDRARVEARVDLGGVTAQLARWPLALEDLRGRVSYVGSKVFTDGLTSRFEGGVLSVRGGVDWRADPRVKIEGDLVGLALSSALGDRIATLPDPCPTVGEQFRQWDPTGFCDVRFALEQKKLADGSWDLLRPAIDAQFRGGASVAFVGAVKSDGVRRGFRYRLRDVRGELHFTDLGLVFDGVTAGDEHLLVEASGKVGYESKEQETYDIDVVARGLRLDERLAEALSDEGRALFESLDAEGAADVAVSVKRFDGEPPGPRVEVVADLLGATLRPEPFPLDVHDVRGRVRILDEEIRIESLKGRHRGGDLGVKGFLGQGARRGDYRLEATVKKLRIEAPLFDALATPAPEVGAALGRLNLSGVASGDVAVERIGDAPLKVKGYVGFERVHLAPESPPIRITDGDGAVEIDGGRITVRPGTTARFAGQRFAVDGHVSDGGALALTLEAGRLAVTPQFLAELAALEPQVAAYGTDVLEGVVSAKVRLERNDGPLRVGIDELRLNGATVRAPGVGAPLEDVHAVVSRTPEGAFEAKDVTARLPWPTASSLPTSAPSVGDVAAAPKATLLHCDAIRVLPRPGGAPAMILSGPLSVAEAPLAPWLFDALPIPEETRAKLAEVGFGGVLQLTVGTLKRDGGAWEAYRTAFEIRDFALGGGLRAGALRSTGDLRLRVDAQGRLVAATRFEMNDAVAYGVPAPRIRGHLDADSHGVRIAQLDADLFGYAPPLPSGAVRPWGKLEDDSSRVEFLFHDGAFDLELLFANLDVAAAVRAMGGDPGETRGSFGGGLKLVGRTGASDTWFGGGSITGHLRKAVDLPFFLQLFKSLDVVTLFQPADPTTRVQATFEIRDRRIESRDVVVDARDVRLEGAARVDFGGVARADLVAHYSMGVMPWTWIGNLVAATAAPGVVIEGPLESLTIRVETPDMRAPIPSGREPKLKPPPDR